MADESRPEQPKKKRAVARVVPIRAEKSLTDAHLKDLRSSGLSDETIELAQLYTEIDRHAIAALLHRKSWPYDVCGNVLVFPLFLPASEAPYAYRVKPTRPRPVGEKRNGKQKFVKYDQADSSVHKVLVYYPPRARIDAMHSDRDVACYWTEGEKKALALDQLGYCAVGLTGVHSWLNEDHKVEGDKLNELIADHVTVEGRHHIIVFDADAPTNENVMDAAARLAGVLLAGRALSVKFVHSSNPNQKGIDDFYAAFGEPATRALLDSAWTIEAADPKQPRKKLKGIRGLQGADIAPDLRLPDGYAVEKDGSLWKIGDGKNSDTLVSRTPILIQRYLEDYYSRECRVEVTFPVDERWESVSVARKAICDSRTMIDALSPYGAPVTSGNAGKLVDWIDALEQTNAGKVDRVPCVDKAGWHTIDGVQTFVLNEAITATRDDSKPALQIDKRGHRKRTFAALEPRGSIKEHVDALNRAWKADPVAAATICGALAAPLLSPLNAAPFGIHLPGDSSRGKTSMAKVAASVYGDPNNEQWFASWNATKVGVELRAASTNDLPLFFDEVGSGDRGQTEALVYMLINGVGKVRGQRDRSLQETLSWKTILLSTGEHELVDETAMTGPQVRVLQFPVAGFGMLSGAEVDSIREQAAANSGMFGRLWVESLLAMDAETWESMRRAFEAFKVMLRDRAGNSPLRTRTANYWALLALAETAASEHGVGVAGGQTMLQLFQTYERSGQGAVMSSAERALRAVEDWIVSESKAFPELQRDPNGHDVPRSTNAPVIAGFRRDDGTVLIVPAMFRAFAEKQNLPAQQVLREWKRLDIIDSGEGSHIPKRVRIGASLHRFIVLRPRREAEDNS